VKAQTPSGGDAIFRAGVEAAASAAMEAGEGASLGGNSPQRFVSGLAQDLGRHTVVTRDCKLHQEGQCMSSCGKLHQEGQCMSSCGKS